MKAKQNRLTVTLIKSKLKSGELVYYARYRDCGGANPQVSLRGLNKHDAKEASHKLELELNQPEVIAARIQGTPFTQYQQKKLALENLSKAPVKEVFDEYLEIVKVINSPKTLKSYRATYKQFCQFLSDQRVDFIHEINYSVLELWKTSLSKKKPTTISTKLNSLYSVFNYCKKKGLINESPLSLVEKPKIPDREIKVFTDDEVTRLLKVAKKEKPVYYALLLTAFDSAARFGELTTIVRKSDFKFEATDKGVEYGLMSITNHAITTKNKHNRFTPITHNTVQVLKVYLEDFNDEDHPFGCINNNIDRCFKKFLEKAGISTDYHFNMIRKTALTRMANSGIDIIRLCEIAGHSSIEITRKFYLKKNSAQTARDIAIQNNIIHPE